MLVIFLDSLIDYSRLHWLVNILVGLLMLGAKIFLPLILTVAIMEYVGALTAVKNESFVKIPTDPANSIVLTSADQINDFLLTHELVDDFETKVVGVTFSNKDGTSRQQILSRCSRGDEVALEFFTYQGAPAYAVISPYGQIGNLDADLAIRIDMNYDGYIVSGMISSITGGYDGLYYGCIISLQFFKPHPEQTSESSTVSPGASLPADLLFSFANPEFSDAVLSDAVSTILREGRVSNALLQQKLNLNYTEASRIIDYLEEIEIIGPFLGSKPRNILIDSERWIEMCSL